MQIDVGLVDRASVSMSLSDEGISIAGVTDKGTRFVYKRVRQIAVHLDEQAGPHADPRVRLEISTEPPP